MSVYQKPSSSQGRPAAPAKAAAPGPKPTAADLAEALREFAARLRLPAFTGTLQPGPPQSLLLYAEAIRRLAVMLDPLHAPANQTTVGELVTAGLSAKEAQTARKQWNICPTNQDFPTPRPLTDPGQIDFSNLCGWAWQIGYEYEFAPRKRSDGQLADDAERVADVLLPPAPEPSSIDGDDYDLAIIRFFAHRGTAQAQEDIAAEVCLDRKAVAQRLQRLRGFGLTSRGLRGERITDPGRAWLSKVGTQTPHKRPT